MSSLEDVFSVINRLRDAGVVDILTRHGLSTEILDGA